MLLSICGKREKALEKATSLLSSFKNKGYATIIVQDDELNESLIIEHSKSQSIFLNKYIIYLKDIKKHNIDLILQHENLIQNSDNLFLLTCFEQLQEKTKARLQKISQQHVFFSEKDYDVIKSDVFDIVYSLKKPLKIFLSFLPKTNKVNEQNMLGALFWYAKKTKNKKFILEVAKLNYKSKLRKDTIKNFLLKKKISVNK